MPRATSKSYHLEIHRRKSHFWSIIKSKNYKIIWQSEMYTTKRNAEIPVKNLINKLGKKVCSLTFIDHNKRSDDAQPIRTRTVKNPARHNR